MPRFRNFACALAALAAMTPALTAAQTAAADWPSRPIRIVVAQAPGGPPDRIARFVAEPLSRTLGVPVTVENRPGASGVIGADHAMRAAPDGYTLLIATLSTHVLVPAVGAGLRVGMIVYGPKTDLFVDRANCGVKSP